MQVRCRERERERGDACRDRYIEGMYIKDAAVYKTETVLGSNKVVSKNEKDVCLRFVVGKKNSRGKGIQIKWEHRYIQSDLKRKI